MRIAGIAITPSITRISGPSSHRTKPATQAERDADRERDQRQ